MGKRKRLRQLIEQWHEYVDKQAEQECDCDWAAFQCCDICQGVSPEEPLEDINRGHFFEIMDRTHIIQCNLDDFIYDHPAISDKMKKKVMKAQNQLTKVYQWASDKYDEFE